MFPFGASVTDAEHPARIVYSDTRDFFWRETFLEQNRLDIRGDVCITCAAVGEALSLHGDVLRYQ